jgi:hypothetical protein
MCTARPLLVDALVNASGASPLAPGCDGVPSSQSVYANAEVEPMIAVNPANANNVIVAWQQDRWSGGGSRGSVTAYSMDGGGTWTKSFAPMSRCTGGAGATAFERASDPWVTFAPDGTAYQVSLSFNNFANGNNAILVSRSTDGGRTWSAATTLRQDGGASLNDKESATADAGDARYVYVAWDRLTGNNAPTWFTRTTDGGTTWETARAIYDPGANRQTLNNQVAVLPNGTLALLFSELPTVDNGQPALLRLVRSTDKGATWSAPITVSDMQTVGTTDPDTGIDIRDAEAIAAITAGANGMLAAVWQDSRFAGGAYDGIAFSKSIDGGITWSPPVRINGNPAVPALVPNVAIASDGTIGVTYYDFRDNTPDPATLPTDVWLATSGDGGVTWSERRIDGPFDYAKAPLVGGRYFLGDYSGMTSSGTSFLTAFGRANDNVSDRSDVVASLARPTPETTAIVAGADPRIAPSARTVARMRRAIDDALRARRRPTPE